MSNLKKLDGSFNITVNGMPYNTTQGDKYFEETLALYSSNPEEFEIEEEATIPEATYSDLRKIEYGNIEDQLDMIYWDKVNGTNLWQEKITEIKAKYSKS